ncbi:leucyl aminopeptidase family protein [Sedimentitalea sp. JM2-8]|uniref:Leucyl aminopeptidase family protein n=1 Tax=Sedimentitalea xiamensis TaxID=3050037 RepID=A0ABT7FKE9_9RHOB|nr:leucyl aminopeptidase family protein [Sedimentitalea xiamensis]MDK3075624.1 leucyl aminopeptidase family protein [Sedimentitalea xiamensis]
MPYTFAEDTSDAIPLHVIESPAVEDWLGTQDERVAGWVRQNGFAGNLGQALLVPGADGRAAMALAGYGTRAKRARVHFALAHAAARLPEATYRISSGLPEEDTATECLGWLLSAYQFDRYKTRTARQRHLVAPEGLDAARIEIIAEAEVLIRDLVNTPTSDMGPADLAEAAETLARTHGADFRTVVGDDLLEQNFPLIHTVGRASATPPRLIDLSWGTSGPKLTLVGKGVCFDTGGLDIKPSKSMALMKKDMGGAATVLGLAQMIMKLDLPVRLRVLIPAVENAISGNAFRPGDILASRKGLTIENNNTDAEGRLVLADALALADEDSPDLIVSMATLTGAARIAVGSDIAPFYTDEDADAQALAAAAAKVDDPVWRLPFHEAYETKIEPAIADLDNAPSGGFAGSITAALFLRRFAGKSRYMHFDIYAWQSANAPARPKGGVGMGARALLDALPDLLKL